MKIIALSLIRIYQLCLSPFVGDVCRFTPSCSCYAAEAIEKHGVFKGIFLSIKRLLRCHPWSNRSGNDPVP